MAKRKASVLVSTVTEAEPLHVYLYEGRDWFVQQFTPKEAEAFGLELIRKAHDARKMHGDTK